MFCTKLEKVHFIAAHMSDGKHYLMKLEAATHVSNLWELL